jgi:7,8-dihydro-6-hydroxymethylpterin-pyrophosphokinase
MARRWLLLLGSSRDDDACVREALAKLSALGPLCALTPIRRFPSDEGVPRQYHNVLAALFCALDRDWLVDRLKQVEYALGRRAGDTSDVAIDIDLLASADDGVRWHADPHAVDKSEFARASVTALLDEARIDIVAP